MHSKDVCLSGETYALVPLPMITIQAWSPVAIAAEGSQQAATDAFMARFLLFPDPATSSS
jgi:hypothetical protein